MAMTSEPIRFTDGAGYDRFMGVWSRLAGQDFLGWIAPSHGQRWLDVGCGNGAFTQLIAQQSEPLSLVGIDPSEAQLAFARQHPLLQSVEFVIADAMALPFPDAAFDLAVMPLVIFFVPDPAQGVARNGACRCPGWNSGRLRLGHGGWWLSLSGRDGNPERRRPAHTHATQSRGLPL